MPPLPPLRALSLFDGLSCGRIALERAGIPVEVYYASEVDTHAEAISRYNYPDIFRLGDVNEIDFRALGQIDLVLAGSPCQSFSTAGRKQKGFQDPRGQLFYQFIRALDELKPRYFLLENVQMSEQSEKTISSTVDVLPKQINSSTVSAQSRTRLYWTNIPIIKPLPNQGIYLEDIVEWDAPWIPVPPSVESCVRGERYSTRPPVVRQGKARRRSRTLLTGLNAYFVPFLVLTDQGYRYPTLTEIERLQTLPDGYTRFGDYGDGKPVSLSNSLRVHTIGNGWTVDVIKHLLEGINCPDDVEVMLPYAQNRIFA
jgi:DNA (cytosine-5)-methyltransferase 3A